MSQRPTVSNPQFERLLNFRDVAASINQFSRTKLLKPGLLFRSARPDETTSKDRELLSSHFRIGTIIDLRTTTEHVNAAKKHSTVAKISQSAVVPTPEVLATQTLRIPGMHYAEINLNGKGFERSLVWQLSWYSLAKLLILMLLGYRMEAISILGREVLEPRGLIGLGLDTLKHSGPEIKELFDVFANQDSWPVLVHCTQGKDRTGIVIALILLLCEVPVDAIIDDYIRSEAELEPEIEERKKEVSSIGLSEKFVKCPKEFVPTVQAYLLEHYGGAQNYLLQLGIQEAQLQQVRAFLRTA